MKVTAEDNHKTQEDQNSNSCNRNVDGKIQVTCPAKPITRAFLQFTDSDERDKYVRSANMFKKRAESEENENIASHGC